MTIHRYVFQLQKKAYGIQTKSIDDRIITVCFAEMRREVPSYF